ncbi:MAG: reverse transcriptase domain-containing protein, partial [Geobacteraceae bacterium]|nr:reverse transcriptase domain-containing protein [Geobacteraceae bacterium]
GRQKLSPFPADFDDRGCLSGVAALSLAVWRRPHGGFFSLGTQRKEWKVCKDFLRLHPRCIHCPRNLPVPETFRNLPRRPVRPAVQLPLESVMHGNMSEARAGVSKDADLAKFFDTVEHDVLMARVSRKVRDKRVLKLIGAYLRAGVVIGGRLHETRKGVPQGGPLSPLLSNILLDELDKELEGRSHRFARYADDFVILVKSRRAGERVMVSVTRFLEKTLKLKVNQEKSKVAHVNEITFLGFSFTGAKIRWSDKAFVRFKQRIKELTGRSWGVSMEYRMFKLAEYLRGWMGYFGISERYRPIPELDHWLRRRVRMCYWKRWRYCRTKVRELRKLGTFLHAAILVGLSRKGPWRLSRTLATQSGMTNQWLKVQGLLSIKDLWVNIHYPATAR